jgi:hypothetical protein
MYFLCRTKAKNMRTGQLIVLFVMFLIPSLIKAQVTTSSLSGTVKSGNETLPGATITAIHQPTGTVFNTTSLSQVEFSTWLILQPEVHITSKYRLLVFNPMCRTASIYL